MDKIFERQGIHFLAYLFLGVVFFYALRAEQHAPGEAWGFSIETWVFFSWAMAGIFQFGVLLVWRLELHFGTIQRVLGRWGFYLFGAAFPIVATARMLAIIPISKSSVSSFPLSALAFWLLILLPMPLIFWAIYSVWKYFGFFRAIGADHFDKKYRSTKLEKRGVFQYVQNPMYSLVLLLLYYPGLLSESRIGLVAAVCHHAFVWIHYYCTEVPDMQFIYGGKSNTEQ